MSQNLPEPKKPTDHSKRLLMQLSLLIDLLEARLGDLERVQRATGENTEGLRGKLRDRVRTCYRVRLALMQGRYRHFKDLDAVLQRAQIEAEHRKFEGRGPIRPEDLAVVDVDELLRQLVG